MTFVSGLMLAGMRVLSDSLVVCVSVPGLVFGSVVCTFYLCFFSLCLDVAGDGAKYLFTIFGEFKRGIPCSWLLFAALLTVWLGGMKKD